MAEELCIGGTHGGCFSGSALDEPPHARAVALVDPASVSDAGKEE